MLIGIATVVGWQVPWGPRLLFPFTVLATFVHEMGHGLTAMLFGGTFDHLAIFSDGSGVAVHHGRYGLLAQAAIPAGGLMGPSLLGGALLAASRADHIARWLLLACALVIWASVLLLVRSTFGVVSMTAWALVLTAVVRFAPTWCAFVLQVVAVQMALSVFQDLDYMFSPGASVDGIPRLSDSAAMAQVLILPYWVWGGVTALLSLAAVGIGGWWALRPATSSVRSRAPGPSRSVPT
ncbi:MAG: M50 family metallopeptidase [Myxococcota bacterium]